MNFRFPIFLDLTNKNCLVVGEGYDVARKVRALLEASARVKYVNPKAERAIEEFANSGRICWEARDFRDADLDGQFLVITDSERNERVFALAEQRNILCNAVDDPEHCRFSFGSVHRQGDLAIAISTNGSAPALAVRLREQFEREIGPEYGLLLQLLRDVRPEITPRIPDFERRRALWYRIVDSEALELLKGGNRTEAEGLIRRIIETAISSTSESDISGGVSDQ